MTTLNSNQFRNEGKDIYQEVQAGCPTLLTDGTEQDLLPIAKTIDSDANVLSVQGNRLENGAEVDVHLEMNGHQLTRTEISAATDWYQKHF